MTTTITRDEALQRLEAANQIRLSRAEFRRRLALLTLPGGCEISAELITTPPVWAEGWSVFGVLMAIRGFGPHKAYRGLNACLIENSLTVGELSPTQRDALTAWLRAYPAERA